MRALLILFLTAISIVSIAQENTEVKSKTEFDLLFKSRYMSTFNEGDLQNFSIAGSSLSLGLKQEVASWFSLGATWIGAVNYGTDKITVKDESSLSGPIYELNLWNIRFMSDDSFRNSLPELYANFNFDNHRLIVGRFIKDTPLMNAEKWPFQTAFQGLWYQGDFSSTFKTQVGLINKINSRFVGEWRSIGNSFGLVGSRENIPLISMNSDFVFIANIEYKLNDNVKLDLWDYYVDNVMNTFFLEAIFDLNKDKGMRMFVNVSFQNRLGNGGNTNQLLTYYKEEKATALSLRLTKSLENGELGFNFTRIGDQGRWLVPREWGKEPFYTFQRRTRVEGASGMTALMVSYKKYVETEKSRWDFSTSIGSHNFQNPVDGNAENKYLVPSNINLDAAIKYTPKNHLEGASLEVFLLHRFLNQDVNDIPLLIINRVNFSQVDFTFTYAF